MGHSPEGSNGHSFPSPAPTLPSNASFLLQVTVGSAQGHLFHTGLILLSLGNQRLHVYWSPAEGNGQLQAAPLPLECSHLCGMQEIWGRASSLETSTLVLFKAEVHHPSTWLL